MAAGVSDHVWSLEEIAALVPELIPQVLEAPNDVFVRRSNLRRFDEIDTSEVKMVLVPTDGSEALWLARTGTSSDGQ
jgi:hypothetical protein